MSTTPSTGQHSTSLETDPRKQRLLAWLNDALAMENALAAVLRHRIRDAKGFPEIEEMDRQHLSETLNHADLVKQCIARLGAKPSMAKSIFGTVFGMVQAPMTGFAKDQQVKNCLIDHATEQFEVASYQALIVAANEVDDTETAATCERIMAEDQAMADRILAGLPTAVAAHLASAAAGGTADSATARGGQAAPGGQDFGQP
jgi:ferritin-like metal-binding protein YciE